MKRATIAILFLSLLSSYASALEKYTVRADDSRIDSWSAGATCRVSYYNFCTGWVWCWGGFPDKSRFGMVVDQCCPKGSTASILSTSFFLCDEAHVGYGFTGTIAVHAVDANNCPIGAPIAVQNYCPIWTGPTPFSVVSWGGVEVPQTFAILVTQSAIIGSQEFGNKYRLRAEDAHRQRQHQNNARQSMATPEEKTSKFIHVIGRGQNSQGNPARHASHGSHNNEPKTKHRRKSIRCGGEQVFRLKSAS